MPESDQKLTITYESDGSITPMDTVSVEEKLQHLDEMTAAINSIDDEAVPPELKEKIITEFAESVNEHWVTSDEIQRIEEELLGGKVQDIDEDAKYALMHTVNALNVDDLKIQMGLIDDPAAGHIPTPSAEEKKVQENFMNMLLGDQRIIAISGLIGAGKDTIADYLVESHGYTKINFADKLKDSVANMFNLDRDLLEGNTPEGRIWREQKLDFWSAEMNMDVTPRYLLQIYGTECMRNGFYDDVWVAFVKQELVKNPDKKYVIPDARFANEGRMVKSLGGAVWRVTRGPDPEWVEEAAKFNQHVWSNSTDEYDDPFSNGKFSVHPSERGMMGFKFDAVVDNDSTFVDLYENVWSRLINTAYLAPKEG